MTIRPPCSVIVPTRGRAEQLRACLESICRSAYDSARLEIVVVNDGGLQKRAVEAAVSSAGEGTDVALLQTEGLGPAAARNVGARHAGGTVLAFTDDDCRVRPDWLALLTDAVGRSDEGAAGGRTVNGLPDDRWAATSQRIVDLVYAHYNEAGEAEFLATNNLAVPADVFRALGGFDERYGVGGEDRAFCRRWRASGRALVYERRAVVEHAHHLTLGGFLRQHFAYGRGAYRFHRDAGIGRDWQVARAFAFHTSLPRLLRQTNPEGAGRRRVFVETAVRLALWEVTNAAGMVWEAAAGRPEKTSE